MTTANLDFALWLSALPLLLIAATLTWLLSLPLRNVAIADSLWALLLFAAGVTYGLGADPRAPRLAFVLWLLLLWAVRLTLHVTARGLGKPVRNRYRASHNWRSLYRVFWPQALVAWVVSLALLGTFASNRAVGPLDFAGLFLWTLGFAFESIADWQLSRFRSKPENASAVLRRGLWRFTRHPNYFGEFCVWWGFWLMALASGAWWSVPGPLLLTFLLLRVTGVRPVESDIGNRRPQYADYVLKTNAFLPGPPRK
jgi:steroid 5-alpha reductase family enzyme